MTMRLNFSQNRWANLFSFIENELTLTSAYNDLVVKYSESHRYYHTVEHIDKCLNMLEEVSDLVDDSFSLEVAIWFHDVVYDPLKKDNEEMSAKYAQKLLSALQVDSDKISIIYDLIVLTQHSKAPETNDEKFLLDIDVSILGADADSYMYYENNIRKEYIQVSDAEYREGREKVLRMFLDSDYIYNTDYFRERFEQQARVNIAEALRKLKA